MSIPIALQLYTVRDQMEKDLEGTLAQVARIGYKNVEFAGLFRRTASDVRKIIDKLGLKAVSGHVGVDGTEDNMKKNADDAKALGYGIVVSGPPDWKISQKGTLAGYRDAVKILGKGAELAKKHGLTHAYHNHSFEYQKLEDGRNGMDILYSEANPPLSSELDVYWVQHGHADPVTWIKKLAGRVPLLHIKDMEKGPNRGFAEVGTGILDMKAVVAAAPAAGVKYFIIEQDGAWVNGNSLESAKLSFNNFSKIAG